MGNPNFVDYVKIFCKSGNGGAGSAHFLRTKNNPRGGPDGGDGGRGGNIILKGNKQFWTLLHLKYTKHIKAGKGQSGMSTLKTGASGKDVVLEVPLGTVAKEAETNRQYFEITEDGQTKILLKGGQGGLGNDHFKSSTNQAPKYAQPGTPGIENWFILELKLLADVGLVGFPNAGKSTLLSVISAARPEIADYPFTTLTPNLGIVKYRDHQSFVVADIPGIIEGAHKGKGLGLRFLRHIERNSLLLFMVPADSDDIRKEFETLENELRKYNPELLDKTKILAITKSDLLDDELMDEIEKDIPDIPFMFISSVTGFRINRLKDLLWLELNK
ncbi:MAG: GTPase ObgE [Bacteroidales bacterium]|nr:GTPase ObgE [Bacteroidales bacterium]